MNPLFHFPIPYVPESAKIDTFWLSIPEIQSRSRMAKSLEPIVTCKVIALSVVTAPRPGGGQATGVGGKQILGEEGRGSRLLP